VGSFHHHFRDKLSLAATVYLELLRRLQHDLLAEISEGEEARLKQHFHGRLTGWLDERAATGDLRALPHEHSCALWRGPAEQLARTSIDCSGSSPNQATTPCAHTSPEPNESSPSPPGKPSDTRRTPSQVEQSPLRAHRGKLSDSVG
jgi:hypothetical protein